MKRPLVKIVFCLFITYGSNKILGLLVGRPIASEFGFQITDFIAERFAAFRTAAAASAGLGTAILRREQTVKGNRLNNALDTRGQHSAER